MPCPKIKWSPDRAVLGRPLGALLLFGGLCALSSNPPWARPELRERDPSKAAAMALGRMGLIASAADVRWVDSPTSPRSLFAAALSGEHRFLVTAHRAHEPTDAWLGRARLSPEGRWLELIQLHNISDTSAVSEKSLTVSAERIAWAVADDADVVALQVLDLEGRKLPSQGDLTWFERLQTRITFFQETGQFAGLCRRAYRFAAPVPEPTMIWTAAGLRVDTRVSSALLTCDGPSSVPSEITIEPSEIGNPGDLVTWAVDRVRALPWFGTDRMQWLKAVAFGLLDRLDSAKRRIVPNNGSKDVEEQVGDFLSHGQSPVSDPETGWPPKAMDPLLKPSLAAEGEFRPLDDDPFATPASGARSPFALAYLRPDPARPDSQVFILAWDPRLLELHTMTGTREPKTATGETGSGMVPREPATISRLAAAFNGGFQATHGEFGMMAERIVYLPPKPYAATVAERADGTTLFGTWPNDEAIPEDLIGFRQNLTPLVADSVVNPYARTWWGGVPPGWEDATRTVRTGLCLTTDSFVMYFYGSSISSEHLAKAMTSARCDYGLHLDMNPGHTGLEFYRVARLGQLPKIERRLDGNWESHGTVPGAPEFEYYGRRMLKTMHLMHFPRYVRTDSRDFFYLTHRYTLPPASSASPPASSASPPRPAPSPLPGVAAGDWQTKEHAQHGYPAALATKRLHPDPARPSLELTVLLLDGKWLSPCTTSCSDSNAVVRLARGGSSGSVTLYHRGRSFAVTQTGLPSGSTVIARGREESSAGKAVAALGIAHRDWLYYAEVTRGGDRSRDASMLKRVLDDLGCEGRLYLDQPLDVSLGDAGRRGMSNDLVLLREVAPIAGRIFRETEVVPPAVWQPLQAKRVRYVRRRTITSDPSSKGQSRSDGQAETAESSEPLPTPHVAPQRSDVPSPEGE